MVQPSMRAEVTHSPCQRQCLPVENDKEQQQDPRGPAGAGQERLQQGRPVDAPCGVTHGSNGN